MIVKNNFTEINYDPIVGQEDSLKRDLEKFLEHHSLITDGEIHAECSGSSINIYPDSEHKIFEITTPGGSELLDATHRWVRLEIEGTRYFVEFWTRDYQGK